MGDANRKRRPTRPGRPHHTILGRLAVVPISGKTNASAGSAEPVVGGQETLAAIEVNQPQPPISDEFRAAIQATLDAFIDAKLDSFASIGSDLTPLLDAARTSITGGKRLRPAFAYWGFRATGSSPDKQQAIYTAAAAIELVHASAIVHDDVMDDSATRRGNPAAHKDFASQWAASGDDVAARFGHSAAILLGDLLLSWSDELLGFSGFKPKAISRARVYFDRLRSEVVAGQYLDVLAQTNPRSSAADAMRVVRYKSAKYTVERPLQFGAALGRGDAALLAALSSYGVPLGEAFQLRDDILGVFGEAERTGKPSGDDIQEGKRTLLIARAFDKADAKQTKVLQRHVGNPQMTRAGLADVQQVLRDTGALTDVETVIAELTSASLSSLKHAPIDDEQARQALFELADVVTNRSL